ncbi:hypothetical protein [Micromonospora echinaurantiaca]|uniref:hypothetical protein n=1 Tax=Micromonospora echinaurantiaca TaxID=47857 RepID=UPI001560AD3C|nr:hypothetical protein [Micromonospora echinaurantiaca]
MLDQDDLIKQLTRMLNALTALDLPHNDLVVPAIGLDPATMISYGTVNVPRNTANFGFGQIVRRTKRGINQFRSRRDQSPRALRRPARRLLPERLSRRLQ